MEHVQHVTARVQAAKLGDARALYDALEAHRRELSGQRGFMSMRINRSSESGGDTLVSVETRWSSQGALEAYDAGGRNAESILREFPDLLVEDSVDKRQMEALDSEAESKSRVVYERFLIAGLVPVVIVGIGLAVIYALSRVYLQMGPGAAATTLAIVISGGILLVAWYFAENAKAPTWQFVGVGGLVVAALIGGTVAAQVMDGPDVHRDEDGEEPPASGGLLLQLDDNVFIFDGEENPTIEVGANVPVVIELDNVGSALHNVHVANPEFEVAFCQSDGATPCSAPERMEGGETGQLEFTLPPGTYDFRCDFHATEMTGTIEVVEGGPTGGEAPPPPPPDGGGEPGAITLELDDNVFLVDGEENPEINVPADVEVTIAVENVGAALHNVHVGAPDGFETSFCETGGTAPCSDPERISGGD
jgi:plastocyanin